MRGRTRKPKARVIKDKPRHAIMDQATKNKAQRRYSVGLRIKRLSEGNMKLMIDDLFLRWCADNNFDVDSYALEVYTRSGDREIDFQAWMSDKTDEEALLLLTDKPKASHE